MKRKIIFPLLLILSFSLSLFAQNMAKREQNISPPISVCELLQNKKKYENKEIEVKAVWEIAFETSPFRKEDGCPVRDSITAGKDDSFESVNDKTTLEKFARMTDLFGMQDQVRDKIGRSRSDTFLRIEITTKGIFLASRKPKFGHLDSYKYAFLMTRITSIGPSRLIPAGQSFNANPEILATADH